jgi:hypothetical protein
MTQRRRVRPWPASATQKSVRSAKDPSAIAHQFIRADRTPMIQILQDQQTLLNNRVALLAFDMGDKAQTTGIVLVGRVVHPLAERGQILRALWQIHRILVAGTFAAGGEHSKLPEARQNRGRFSY